MFAKFSAYSVYAQEHLRLYAEKYHLYTECMNRQDNMCMCPNTNGWIASKANPNETVSEWSRKQWLIFIEWQENAIQQSLYEHTRDLFARYTRTTMSTRT